MRRAITALLLSFAFIVPAQADAPMLLPKLKPKNLMARHTKQPPATQDEQPIQDIESAPSQPAPLKIRFPATTAGYKKADVLGARKACAERLKGLDLVFEPLAPIGKQGGCGTAAPILLTEVAGVTITPPAETNCALAEALFHWVAWSVKPAAAKHLKKKLVTINNASSYACRRRNNKSTGKLSEHAFANAFDVSTLAFSDGSSTNIKGDWSGLKQLVGASGKAAFLRTIRQYACLRFTTVLGPGSDPYHGDHFHVDLAKRRPGSRVCR